MWDCCLKLSESFNAYNTNKSEKNCHNYIVNLQSPIDLNRVWI